MANAVRKICTKIGNGHHYLMGTTVKTAYSGSLISDTVQQHPTKSQQVIAIVTSATYLFKGDLVL
jgi:hypothetical protein